MSLQKRAGIALAAVAVLLAIGGGALLAREAADEGAGFDAVAFVDDSATVHCEGSVVELDFDPKGDIEARVRETTVAAADARRRGLNEDACTRAPTQTGWSVRVRYRRTKVRTTVRCRFPGRFAVHVHPVSPSWAGERPAGSAVYLVLRRRLEPGPGPNRTILASAVVLERPDESTLAFAAAHCTAS